MRFWFKHHEVSDTFAADLPLLMNSNILSVWSTAASEVPQAAGRDPTVEGAAQPEGRASQTAGVGDQEHQKLPTSELALRL